MAHHCHLTPPPSYRWTSAAQSVRGAQHVRDNRPNQDFWHARSLDEGAVILAVSDGHGSERCCRSATGARLATELAVEMLADVVAAVEKRAVDHIDPASVATWAELPQALATRWIDAVCHDIDRNPLTAAEEGMLHDTSADGGTPRECGGTDQKLLAYGTTLLAVAATSRCLLFVQLGDGEIMLVFDDSANPASPLPADTDTFANETSSLCQPQAHLRIRCRAMQLDSVAPRLVILTTDGYPNSFETDADFRQTGPDLRDAIRSRGLNSVSPDLATWLGQASLDGSGDDCTLALVWREDVDA